MKYICLILLWSVFPTMALYADTSLRPVSVVPCPEQVTPGAGKFIFSPKTDFAVENEEQAEIARCFTDLFARAAGFTPRVKVGEKKGKVSFLTDTSLKSEAYCLEVTPKRITVKASDGKGFFYALQTLRQLLPASIEREEPGKDTEWAVPAVSVSDAPRFGYRGLMVDVARFFTPKENLLRIIDCAAMLKINTLHLHLVDDNGWRIEIKKYPLLTEIGSRRVERPGKSFPERRNARQGEPTVEKGFYTQDDIREIVAYAGRRQMEVIPEIEMPAHSNAALAAYPLLACPVVDKFIGVLPGLGGNHADVIFCAGNDSVFTFLQGVIDEVVELFPSRYIHLGGDEAWKTHWKECPLCQARMQREGLEDEEALQGYFMARMSRYVQSKGKEVMGWDELTNTKIPDGAIIFGWRGSGQAAVKAAEQGHRFVMTPARILYLIRYQGPQWFEPLTYFGNNTLKDAYTYEPIQQEWNPQVRSLLMGVQASMWTEFCNKPEDVEYQLFPRLAALAEVAWTQPQRKDWKNFLVVMDHYNAHLSERGITFARSMYNIQHTVTPVNGRLQVTLDCERPDVEVRYTTDGSEPDAHSPLYKTPLTVTKAQTVKCATFRDGGQTGKTLTLPLGWNKATAKPVSGNHPTEKLLVNGVRGSLRQSDFEWCSWESSDSIAFTVDLQKKEPIRRVTLGCITNYGMAAHKPARIEVWISTDNKDYHRVAERQFTDKNIFREGNFKEDVALDLKNETARYVRVIAKGAGSCPITHVRPGQEARVYLDEVIIE